MRSLLSLTTVSLIYGSWAAPFCSTSGNDATNPLAWPLYAEAADLAGLPPTVISVNECDPLRDEGVLLGRKMVDAGVDATTINVMGTCHGADTICRGPIMDTTIRNIAAFAKSLPPSDGRQSFPSFGYGVDTAMM